MFDRPNVTGLVELLDGRAGVWLRANEGRYMDALNQMGAFIRDNPNWRQEKVTSEQRAETARPAVIESYEIYMNECHTIAVTHDGLRFDWYNHPRYPEQSMWVAKDRTPPTRFRKEMSQITNWKREEISIGNWHPLFAMIRDYGIPPTLNDDSAEYD